MLTQCLLCAVQCARGFQVGELTGQAPYGTNRKNYIIAHYLLLIEFQLRL